MSKNRKMLETLLEESGAILKGHFKLTSGRHSNIYFEKFRVLENPKALSALCTEIADHFRGKVDIVAGPTTGGIIIAFEVARQMDLTSIYVESVDGMKMIRRNATIPPGARVLIVDDVLTTGLSVQETAEAITLAGGKIAGVGVLIDRATNPVDFGAPLFASYKVEAESWAEHEIPGWLQSIAITKPGTRA